MEQSARAGHADVEQPLFLTDLLWRAGEDERQRTLVNSQQRHCIPLQALRRMQCADRYALPDGDMLRLGAAVQLG